MAQKSISGILAVLLLCSGTLILLDRCGVRACVAGIGVHGQEDCEIQSPSTTTTSSTPTTSTFQLTVSPTSVVVGQTAQITASGGTYGPYTFSIDPSSNPAPNDSKAGFINATTGLYSAPSNISPSTSVTITIRATDTMKNYNTVTLTVTAG